MFIVTQGVFVTFTAEQFSIFLSLAKLNNFVVHNIMLFFTLVIFS